MEGCATTPLYETKRESAVVSRNGPYTGTVFPTDRRSLTRSVSMTQLIRLIPTHSDRALLMKAYMPGA